VIETIKDYLVSLGFAVDKSSYNEATKVMDEAGQSVTKFAGKAVTQFATAGAAVVSFAVTATIGIAKFLDGLGKAAIQNEILARQLWTTEQNAMAFNATLKAMGVELKDLYLSPTLMNQFMELRKEAASLPPPADYKTEMQLIQSVSFEFTRMKLEATYAMQWIGYYLVKYMSGPIEQVKKLLQDINGVIIKEMPSWTKTVAQVMSWFAQFGITTVRAIKDVLRVFDDIGQGIPKNIKLIGGALAALGLIIETGPIGMMIAGFTLLILLINDFYTYLDGGDSLLGPFWKKMQDAIGSFQGAIDSVKTSVKGFFDDLNKNGTLDNFVQTFQNTFDIIKQIFEGAKKWVSDLWDELQKQGVLTDLKNSFEDVLLSATNLSKTVSGLIKQLLGLNETKNTLGGIGDLLSGTIITALETINGLLESISSYVNGINSMLKGTAIDNAKQGGAAAEKRLEEKGMGSGKDNLFGAIIDPETYRRIGTYLNNMLTKWSDPDAADLTKRFIGNFANSLSPNQTPGYIYPTSTTNNNQRSTVNLSQTNNIYGSDPKATADAAQNNFESMMYLRNFSGVTR
jgi:hypothetical protein